jgi:hypothetical protein
MAWLALSIAAADHHVAIASSHNRRGRRRRGFIAAAFPLGLGGPLVIWPAQSGAVVGILRTGLLDFVGGALAALAFRTRHGWR